jgi:hypothetical protein
MIVAICHIELLLHSIHGRSLLAGVQDVRGLLGPAASRFLLVGIGTDDAVLDQLAIGSFKPSRRRRPV